MPFAVVRTSQARAAVDARMTGKDREAYRAAVEQLEGEGCRAGGYRLRGADSDDYPLCCKHLRGAWRMFTAYVDDGRIVIVAIDRHTPRNNPAETLSALLPKASPQSDGAATTNRRAATTRHPHQRWETSYANSSTRSSDDLKGAYKRVQSPSRPGSSSQPASVDARRWRSSSTASAVTRTTPRQARTPLTTPSTPRSALILTRFC